MLEQLSLLDVDARQPSPVGATRLSDGTTLLLGDALQILPTLPEQHFHCCVTSPPYFKLRTGRGTPGFVGWEGSEEKHIEHLVEIFAAIRRVLRDDGTLWIVYGDSHGKSGARLLPQRLALALQTDGWRVESDIVWSKLSIVPESHGRRPASSYEHILMLSKDKGYFYDSYGERESYKPSSIARYRSGPHGSTKVSESSRYLRHADHQHVENPAGRSLWSVWTLKQTRYHGVHTSAFPVTLPERILRLATSRGGCCQHCGTPYRRVIERKKIEDRPNRQQSIEDEKLQSGHGADGRAGSRHRIEITDKGFVKNCDCDQAVAVPSRVLDCFSGSGTTALACRSVGNLECTLIEIDPGSLNEAAQRLS